ncbi:ribonuclease H-like domain-containing protein [Aspergillus crustosus]
MVYPLKIYTDGGCRNNGKPNPIGAAAASVALPTDPRPTSQRAEITGIILALQRALQRSKALNTCPRLQVTVYSDSRYAVNCMNEWIYKWIGNGWVNAARKEVVNRDLLKQASELDDEVKGLGSGECASHSDSDSASIQTFG